MDQVDNPYTPNAGALPPAIVGRTSYLEDFKLLLARLTRGKTEQSMIITGLRGVGKTVLLRQFIKEAERAKWVVVDIEISKNDDDSFRRSMSTNLNRSLFDLSPKARWNDKIKRVASILKSFSLQVSQDFTISAALDVDAADGYGDHGNLIFDLTDVLTSLGEAAQSKGTGVVLVFDEVHFLSKYQLEAVIEALHKCVQNALPITMVAAGLPQIAELAGDAKSYAERLFKFPRIGNLKDTDARKALAGPAYDEGCVFTDSALDESVHITGGYPYFLQELGWAAWPLGENNTIDMTTINLAIPHYEAKLDDSFFRVRLDRATELQKAYLRAMAELGDGPQRASDVASIMGRTTNNLGPTRSALIQMGLLYQPEYGLAEYTVPHFGEYMKRAIPELIVPSHRKRQKTTENE